MTFNPDLIPFQQALKGLGYDPGPVDGKWGTKTKGATIKLVAADGASALRVPKPTVPAVAKSSGGIIYQGSARYVVDEICVHCSDTRPEWMATSSLAMQVAEIRRWHMTDPTKLWKDIGYHWIIGRDGSILPGRAETTIGAGVKDHNAGVIHAVLIGGHGSSETDRFEEHFTSGQDRTMRATIIDIKSRTPITRTSGHNEWAAKACPGFYVPNWLKEQAA